MSNSIMQAWEAFKENSLKGASPEKIADTRLGFYCGFLAVCTELLKADGAVPAHHSRAIGQRRLEALRYIELTAKQK